MDTEKLLNLLTKLQYEEKTKITTHLNNLRDFFTQAQQGNNPNIGKNIDNKWEEISGICNNSLLNDLTVGESKYFEKIGGAKYFGHGLFYELNKVINSNQYNTPAIVAELSNFIKSRNDFNVTINQIVVDLKKLNIEPHFYVDEVYEIGVLIPCKHDYTNIQNIEKQLHNWNFILKTLNEITNNETTDIKVSRASTGSIELYFNQAVEVAESIGTIISKIGVIYLTINEIRKHRLALKKLKAPSSETDAIEKHEKELIDKEIDTTVENIIKPYVKEIEKGRKQELTTGLKKGMRFIARSIDNGIEIEIIPPELSAPEKVEEEDVDVIKREKEENLKKFEEKREKANLIKKSGNTIKEITGIGEGLLKMLTNGDDTLGEE
ncbi:hypothetical protein SLH46_03695 [Draconibacterium sp. IB214405]|uniref:hypothetical protein n=1 Tax=Draconibacterium sp. IB214405 TaxID=3097352 RepID=UPI002A1273A5|nr:hypothetical protein [Draconibacterium sp. IB214405]MDX8338274.1 hypothetical protein [Draconibacterium sp. IB214405]